MLKNMYTGFNDAIGSYEKSINLAKSRGMWLILMYHRVVEHASNDPFHLGMCVQASNFDKQLRYLTKHFEVWSISKVIQYMVNNNPLPKNLASISFDDGYHDNFLIASPILEKYNLPWTLYVTTGHLEQKQSFWWDRVIVAFEKTKKKTIDLTFINSLDNMPILSLNQSCIRNSLIKTIEILWHFTIATIEKFIAIIQKQLDVHIDNPTQNLTINDIQALLKTKAEIGSHTVKHPNLTLLNHEDITFELQASKQYLESITQSSIDTFAYPGGYINEHVATCVEETGYKCALSTFRGFNNKPTDFYQLQRIGMADTNIAHFKYNLAKIYKQSKADYEHGI